MNPMIDISLIIHESAKPFKSINKNKIIDTKIRMSALYTMDRKNSFFKLALIIY